MEGFQERAPYETHCDGDETTESKEVTRGGSRRVCGVRAREEGLYRLTEIEVFLTAKDCRLDDDICARFIGCEGFSLPSFVGSDV